MPKRRLIWHLLTSYLIVIVIAVIGVTWYMAVSMKKVYLAKTADDLQARAVLMRSHLPSLDKGDWMAAVDSLCKKLGRESATRFTIILPSGKVIGDTDDDPSAMNNHADRPEIQQALTGANGVSTRYSHTLHETMMYIAVPLEGNEGIVAIVRAALPITAIDRAVESQYPRIALGGAVIALLAGLLSLFISRRISSPLEKMQKVAFQFSQGDFAHKLPPGSTAEIDGLAEALNHMAAELDERIKTVVGQRNELDAVLSSMIEGVLVFDTSEKLVRFNREAARMVSLDSEKSTGRYMQEVIRNPQLQKFVSRIFEKGYPLEGEIETHGEPGRVLQMHGTILKGQSGVGLGALVVLNDITSLRRLENVRRDFVANVSHELRTPITSIKGFVETLREGALQNPADAERFLDIIARQSDRLNSIIEDLLALSKIEEAEESEIPLDRQPLCPVLRGAIDICASKARARGISIELNCSDNLQAKINKALLEQAISNLLDNAIKYSNENSRVELSAAQTPSEILISVRDWGCGIERKHLPRLFERFYTVDKARSRELGGTGLGLAIVNHIATAHRGRVSVESEPGSGSTFCLYLPL